MKKRTPLPTSPRRLLLATETIRALSNVQLIDVAGGVATSPGPGCKPTDILSRVAC